MLSFLKDRSGGVAPLLALAAIPIMGSVGAAVDYSRANSARTAMQAAADSAALFIARNMTTQSPDEAATKVTALFATSFNRSDVQISSVTATPASGADQKTLTVAAAGSIETTVLRVMGVNTIALAVTSATASDFDGKGCVLALDTEVSDAFTGTGGTNINLKGCSLYDNSKHSQALTVGGSAKVSALAVGIVGGLTPGSTGLTADNGIATGITPIVDPYKDVEPAVPGACTDNNLKVNKSVTLDPGVYCGGIAIHSGSTVTLNPGIYYMDGGDLVVNGNAALVGNGVTLVFTSKNKNTFANAVFNGTATIDLTAPTFGPTAGIVMFGDRNMPKGTAFKLTGGATQNFGGAVYLPKAAVEFSGGKGSHAACTQLIGNTINISGNTSLAISCSSQNTKSFGTWQIRLTG